MIQDVSCATLSLIISLLNWMSCAFELLDLSARDFETLRSAKKIMQKPDFEIWPKFSKTHVFLGHYHSLPLYMGPKLSPLTIKHIYIRLINWKENLAVYQKSPKAHNNNNNNNNNANIYTG